MSVPCRCGLLFDSLEYPRWLPDRDPEPGPEVQAVAHCGRDPKILRYARTPGGWLCQGAAAAPYESPPKPWAQVGQCWDGSTHPVYDVTSVLRS